MEELYKELLLEVTKVLQKRYNHMAEARRQTEEIAGELQREDRVNVQMLLEMREAEINALRENDRSLCMGEDDARRPPHEFAFWRAGFLLRI